MDETMSYEPSNASRGRKRSSVWIATDEEMPHNDSTTHPEDEPSKKLLSNRGEAIHTNPQVKYNTQKLLNHLAFTRVYVTANFANYNPQESFVLLCMASEQNGLYEMLWYIQRRVQLLMILHANKLLATCYPGCTQSHQLFKLSLLQMGM